MKTISDEELLRITVQFYGKDFTEATPEKQCKILKAERETNEQIEKAGGVQNWYASGQGRVFEFEHVDDGNREDTIES